MEQKKINIIIKGYDNTKVDNTAAWVFKKFFDAGVKITNNKLFLPNERFEKYVGAKLPNKWEIFTVLKSPRGHKNAQRHLGRVTHKRLIQVSGVTLADLNKIGLTGSYPEISKEVLIEVKV